MVLLINNLKSPYWYLFVIFCAVFIFWAIQENKVEIIEMPKECLICEPQTITKEIPIEKIITKEVIKEVPIDKIVYTDKVIYKESPDCKLDLVYCNNHRKEMFELYSQTRELLESCQTTTTDFRVSYRNLLTQFEIMLDILGNPNTEYLLHNKLVNWVNQFTQVASTSEEFLKEHK